MARVVLEIIQKLTGARSAEDAQKSLDSLVSTAKNATVAVAAMGATFKQAFELAKEGASLNQLEESFERMNAQVFKTPDLLEKMSAAARGTIKDTDLMAGLLTLTAGASDEMSRRFAEAAPQLLEIAKASNKLNPALGDTSFLFQSIATGIKRGSPLILDNLGLTIKVGEANERMAESLGKTVQELSAEEKVMAILNETLRSGDQLIQQVGGNVDSQADSFAQLEVAVAEVTDGVKQWLGQGLGPLIRETMGLTRAVYGADGALARMNDTTRAEIREMIRMAEAAGRHGVAGALEEQLEAMNRLSRSEMATGGRGGRSQWSQWSADIVDHGATLRNLARDMDDVARAADEVEKEVVKVAGGYEMTAKQAEFLRIKQQRLRETIEEVGHVMFENISGSTFLEMARGASFFNESMDELGDQLVRIGGRTFQQNQDLDALQKAYDRAADRLHEYEIGLRGAGMSSDELSEAMQEQRDEMGRLAAIMQPLKDNTGQLVSTTVRATFDMDALNRALIDQTAAAGGSALTVAQLGLATGEMSSAQAKAALQAAVTQERIQSLARQVAEGTLSVEAAITALDTFAQDWTASVKVDDQATAKLIAIAGLLDRVGRGAHATVTSDVLPSGGPVASDPNKGGDKFLGGVTAGDTAGPPIDRSINLGGINAPITVNAGAGQDARAIAREVSMILGSTVRSALRSGAGATGRAT